jgi:signal transduction histidine kinase
MSDSQQRALPLRGPAFLASRPFWGVVGAIGLTLLFWTVAVYSIASQIGKPFPGFFYNPQRVVSSFTPRDFSGPRAGLRPWDMIVAVNGEHWREMPRLVAEAGVGGTLVYTVERGGEQLEIAVPTMLFSDDIIFNFLPGYVISSLIFLGIGIFIYRRNPAGALNRYLLVYLLVWALGGSVVWEVFLSPHKWTAYFLLPYAITAPVAGWIFFWTFPSDPGWRKAVGRLPVVRVFIAIAVITVLAMTGLHVAASVLDSPALWRVLVLLQGWPYFAIFGLGSIPIKSLPLLVIIGRQKDRLRRQQALVMLAGLIVGLCGWYLFLWAPAAVHVPPVAHAQWGGLVAAAYPLSIGYGVLRYRLLDIRVVVRKGLIYSLLTATLTGVFLVLALLSGYLFQSITGRTSLLAMIIPALLVAFLFQPVRSRIQNMVDRVFFQRDLEVRQELTRFSRSLNRLRTQTEIVELVRDTLVGALGAAEVTLWLAQNGRYLPVPPPGLGVEGLIAGGPLATWLATERRALHPAPSDASTLAEALRGARAAVAVPLCSGNTLVGILTLGEKRSGEAYWQDDLDLLEMLADSTALALENARLHEERVELVRQQFIQAATIQEEERRRIARELHDGVGSALAGLNIRLHRVGRHLEHDHDPMAGEVKELAAETQISIHDIRRLVYDLRPVALDELGLLAALQEYVARYQIDQGLRVILSAPESLGRLPAAVEATLFRIAQEALTNVAKHAQARRVELRLCPSPAGISMHITDDGQGFQQRETPSGDQTGLWSMQKRVEQFGGCFRIESVPGRGTRITVEIPLHAEWLPGGAHG